MDVRRRALTQALVSLALLMPILSGCGGDEQVSRGEYEEQLAATSDDLDAALERLNRELEQAASGSGSLDEAAAQVGEIRSELDEAADELGDLEPPEDAEAAHEQLVDGLESFSVELAEFEDAIESGDVDRIQSFVRDLDDFEGVQDVAAATDRLREQGYDLEGATGAG
jgi:DNA repair exonuclease SbcCD ATPase subunit